MDSPRSWIESLTPEKLNRLKASLTDTLADKIEHDWSLWSRPEQQAPAWDWQTWLYLAGRGAGKTRSGAEWVRQKVKSGSKHIALISPIAADIRKVMIEGPSGIFSTSWALDRDYQGHPMGIPEYEPSKSHKLTWANGAVAYGYSAEEPDRLRGPQHDCLWADEVAAWYDPDAAWDMAMFGLRLGTNPQAMVTTTPRPIPLIREMLANEGKTVAVTRGRTRDNRRNLAPVFLAKIVSKYQGTRLGRQELDAEVIEEVEGALWNREMIRVAPRLPDMRRIVVAVDPATSAGGLSALTGIVACGLGVDNQGYVLADESGRYSPAQWGAVTAKLYKDLKADRIVAEGNQGGEMVRHVIETAHPNLPISIVHATHGKQARAEPVAALFEQKRMWFSSAFPELTDQLCTWAPLEGLPSPDRLDAMVWAFTDLMLDGIADISGIQLDVTTFRRVNPAMVG